MPYSIFPTGVTIYDPEQAWNGYVLFGSPDGRSHLIDNNGNEVRTWSYLGFPSEILNPNVIDGKRGHILVQLSSTEPGPWSSIFNNKTIGELDWEGNIVWQWGEQAPGGAARQHHDWTRLPNGNTLILSSVEQPVPGVSTEPITDQAIYEITPAGEIIWKWTLGEHIQELGITPEGFTYLQKFVVQSKARTGGFATFNNMDVLGSNRWFAAGDNRFHPDNIIVDAREGNFIAIIEKATGKIVWQLGPNFPDRYDVPHGRIQNPTIPRPVDQISGQHDAHLIPEGLPGAGNLLVFDNQGSAGFPPAALGMFSGSRVLEINPITKEIVWQYTGENSGRPVWSFHSSFISSARRLPNGNTLIDEGMYGRIFQVTPDGEIVWEYVSPYFGQLVLPTGKVLSSNWVYRAQPVPYDWVPEGTARSQHPIAAVDLTTFRIPIASQGS